MVYVNRHNKDCLRKTRCDWLCGDDAAFVKLLCPLVEHAWSICPIFALTCAVYLLFSTRQRIDRRAVRRVDRREFIMILTRQVSRPYRYVSQSRPMYAGYRSSLLPMHVQPTPGRIARMLGRD